MQCKVMLKIGFNSSKQRLARLAADEGLDTFPNVVMVTGLGTLVLMYFFFVSLPFFHASDGDESPWNLHPLFQILH